MIELTLEMAEQAARAARARGREMGIPLTVSVVDESGRLVLAMRANGAGFLAPDTARGKAAAAVAFRRPTLQMAEAYGTNTPFWASIGSLAPGQVIVSAGGVPITVQDRVIGGIGCAGGSGAQDHECAVAGAAAVLG